MPTLHDVKSNLLRIIEIARSGDRHAVISAIEAQINLLPASYDDGVRGERTGWRDARISARHREWGFNCPCVDLDFLVVEYNLGLPVALVEYKHARASLPDIRHATYRALTELANGYKDPLPFLIARYWPNVWAFKVLPVNDVAKQNFEDNEALCERDYVRRLYTMRHLTMEKHLEDRLNTDLPSNRATTDNL